MAVVVALGAACALAGWAGAPAAHADVVWLCQPGAHPNPCRDTLETTVYEPDGASRVENPPLPADPPIDCFYVYPTVSEQRSQNANKDIDRELVAIARYQASRYSQICRVWAPVYRQQTLIGLGAGGSPQSLQLAYSDVAEAWRDYLARHNRGRPFVLLGHSQGTRMLRELVRREIDPRADVRGRLVSAVLLGGNVLVRRGQKVGGDFQHVPACTAAGQTGCVHAFSTFNETPPPNSRYGRPPASDTSGFGSPAGPEYEVLCTNPASPAENARRPVTTLLRSEPYPGFIGLLLTEMYGGPPPSAPTPWLVPRDHYTARCEQREGANVLMLEPIAGARRLNPAPEPSWGLHLADANIAMGDLVERVAEQARAFQRSDAAARPRRPALGLRLRYRRGRDARGRRCAASLVRVRLVGRDRTLLRRVDFRVGRRLVGRDRRAPFRVGIARSRLRAGQLQRLSVRAWLDDGRTVRLARRVRACP